MLQMKQDDKFSSSRLLSKEKNSKAESSFRVLYYGKSCGSVPFTWETKPGTPKHPLSHSSLPPLTPPPSFNSTPKAKPTQKGSKPNFLLSIFHRKSSKKSHVSPSYPSPSISWSSRSSSSFSSASAPMNSFIHRRGWLPRSRSTGRFGIFDGHDDHEAAAGAGSPTSTSCLGGGHGFFRQFSSRRSKVNVKYPF
ncbi:hypothetical protein RHSIM_Rhsim09G0183700 [Rhododendron simsii]|uniref:Uncharacterized protein n=1 Tax=Rhododendron simsii TaxID=118357 RepID=A0A834LDT4_RHOSS|nr:hypothetical protein RHSIM_Rhsim09G0183700 [Rhododendron simsii]